MIWGTTGLCPPHERAAVGNKTGANGLGFAVLLKFFQLHGRFPREAQEIPAAAIEHVAANVGVDPASWSRYAWSGSNIEYHRAQVRKLLGYRELLIEPPATDHLERILRAAIHNHEIVFCEAACEHLSTESRAALDRLLLPLPGSTGLDPAGLAPLHYIASDPGRAGLRSIEEHVAKLDLLRAIRLPSHIFRGGATAMLRSLRDRAAVEEPFELRRHAEPLRLALLAAFCCIREQEIVDLLIATVHRIGARAEQRVENELLEDLRRVAGKTNILFRVAEAALAHPDDTVRTVVYPVVHEDTLLALVKEARASGSAYRQRVQTVIRNSYRGHYRRMVPAILRALEFHSSNEAHRPVIRALELLQKYTGSRKRVYPPNEDVPIEGVVPAAWQDAVVDRQDGSARVDRVAYEICTLRALREQLRRKEASPSAGCSASSCCHD